MKAIPVRKIRPTRKEPSFTGNFDVRKLEDMLAGGDMVQELHRHDFYLILAIEKGAGDHAIDFKPYEVTDNTVFFMRPGQVHQLRLKAGSTGYIIQFNTDFYTPQKQITGKLLRKAGKKEACRLDIHGFKRLLPPLAYIFQEFTRQQEGYQEILKANLDIFMIELLRQRQDLQPPLNKSSLYSMERLEEFLELVERHVSTNKQASDYAGMMLLSINQLNAITRSTLGKSSSEIIREYLLLEARRNVLATSCQIKEIAYRLGYDDVSYFIRFFKKHIGYSPDVYRKKFG